MEEKNESESQSSRYEALLSDSELDAELQRLAHLARTKRRKTLGSAKTLLAVLLSEAHRRDANVRGMFLSRTRSLGISDATANKYRQAAAALSAAQPELYGRVLAAVREGGEVPRLPRVSALAALPGLRKRARPGDGVEEVLDRSVPLRAALLVRDKASFGDADALGRKTLRTLDDAASVVAQLAGTLSAVVAGEAGRVAPDLLDERLEKLRVAVRAVEAALHCRATRAR